MADPNKDPLLLSIGAISRATGVPVETLRTWERRYGFPGAERTSTGHRRYSPATLQRLRLVVAAVQRGHRPSIALVADEPELHLLLGTPVTRLASNPASPSAEEPAEAAGFVAAWVELIRRFDGRALERELRASIAALGAPRFLALRAAPLITEIGERWSDANVGVRHEHFASERLKEFLARHWQPLSDAATGPKAICATPEGEQHTLGLQMVAFTLALANVRVVYLGADLPATEIAQAAVQHAARAVVLSAALGLRHSAANATCDALRAALGPEFPIVVGGRGFSDPPSHVTHLANLAELDRWARALAVPSR
jgi:MerR family transcriptional regulator, light-induced transcriptional regulator